MHVYTYYLETTGISQAHKKNVWEHGSENTWLIVYAAMGQTCCRHWEGSASQSTKEILHETAV